MINCNDKDPLSKVLEIVIKSKERSAVRQTEEIEAIKILKKCLITG